MKRVCFAYDYTKVADFLLGDARTIAKLSTTVLDGNKELFEIEHPENDEKN